MWHLSWKINTSLFGKSISISKGNKKSKYDINSLSLRRNTNSEKYD